MKQKIRTILLGLLAIFTLYCYWVGIKSFFHKPVKPPTYLEVVKTDTVYVDRPYEVPKPYKVYQDPKTIIEYRIVKEKDLEALKKLQLRISEDSILLTGLKEKISIHENYLKQYPKSPKLLTLDLTKYELALSLLDITGTSKTYMYPISTRDFKYRWVDGTLGSKPDPYPKQRNRLNYYIGFGGMILQNPKYVLPTYTDINPYLSFKIDKRWARNNLYINSQIGLLKNNPLIFQVGLERNLRRNE